LEARLLDTLTEEGSDGSTTVAEVILKTAAALKS